MNKFFISGIVAIVVLLAAGGYLLFTTSKPTASVTAEHKTLTIFWAEWKPADYLQQLTEDFTKETGIKVTIVQDSWGTWTETFAKEMDKKENGSYDMVVGDSQWLGRGVADGNYVELSDWIYKNNIADRFTEASMAGYAEYPKGKYRYWAIPVEGDAAGFSYRKDLFEDPKEKAAFKKKYGYELAPPKTWYELKDIAEFFYRPQQDFYGILVWTDPKYDAITMGIDSLVWAWGANLGDPLTYKVDGVLNTKEGVDALTFYKELNSFNNPKWAEYYLDTKSSSNQPMIDGSVAMAMGYFAINPELLDKEKNPNYYDKIGFFAMPKGPKGQYASLGGQGVSIVSHSKKKEEAFMFLEWFAREDVQKKWAELGGLSCNIAVLHSDAFLNASPLNKPFVESMEIVRDFWAVPEYSSMLVISQKYWYKYVVEGSITAQEAMDSIAKEWEAIFEAKGYYKQ
jgi:multiple sugar transport system substrate-binding protein